MKPRVCVVVGHEAKAPGAESVSGASEYEYNSLLAGKIMVRLTRNGIVDPIRVTRDNVGYNRLPDAIDQYNPVCAVELHFNASDGHGQGTEVLHWHHSILGKVLAGILQGKIVEALETKDRGLRPVTMDDRGGYLLGHTRCVCVIVEPFFGDNHGDFNRGATRIDALADAIASGVEKFATLRLQDTKTPDPG
jgi:N-acetylmuramoyl-L-alanine amidase